MQIFIIGTMQIFPLEVEECDEVDSLKTKIQEVEYTSPREQRLIFGSKQLKGGRSLSSYNIREGATIALLSAHLWHCSSTNSLYRKVSFMLKMKRKDVKHAVEGVLALAAKQLSLIHI